MSPLIEQLTSIEACLDLLVLIHKMSIIFFSLFLFCLKNPLDVALAEFWQTESSCTVNNVR